MAGWQEGEPPRRARVAWVAELQGGERQVSLRFEVEAEGARGRQIARCAQADLRRIEDNWFLEGLPVLAPGPCQR